MQKLKNLYNIQYTVNCKNNQHGTLKEEKLMINQNLVHGVASNYIRSSVIANITKPETITVVGVLVGAGLIVYLINQKYTVSCKYKEFDLNLCPQ